MRKNYLLIFGLVLLLFTVAPMVSSAAFGNLLPNCDPAGPLSTGGCGLKSFLEFINNIIVFLMKATFFVAPLFIVYGGFVMLTSGGNSGKFDQGKDIIRSALVGIVIALISYLLITVLFRILQVTFPFQQKEIDITNTNTPSANPNSSFGGGSGGGGGFGGGW